MSRTSNLLQGAAIEHAFFTAREGDLRRGNLPPGVAVARQVHGTGLFEPRHPGRGEVEADAVLARVGLGAGVLTADCVPMLVADPELRIGAAVHAGWRGTRKNVLGHAITALIEAGASPARLLVAIGPCIRACCYQVGEDLLSDFVGAFGPGVAREDRHLDLVFANQQHITSLGIPRANVDDLRECTFCAREGDMYAFHSHRRSGDAAGRQLSWLRP